ncbi:hypothetical protein [Pseudovibrio sp. Alg231-02]|uniref:hypothetical protein n=1 Tax=Pseudovibrio sp. Alg231-02 TaxID=1922223 RepID=UPI000D55CBF5|nr:hypothetical protein [Pseudovibrio sp. Alg231-02]
MTELNTVAANDAGHLVSPKSPPRRTPPAPSKQESHADYAGIVVQQGRWRVIVCRDGIQWIIQKGDLTRDGWRWTGKSYCRTRKALLRDCVRRSALPAPPELHRLPERINLQVAKVPGQSKLPDQLHPANDSNTKAAA